jgi:hypothetical protein
VLASLEQALSSAPGMSGVYLGNELPGTGWSGDRVSIEGRAYARPQDRPVTRWLAVTPAFFDVFHVKILRGRAIGAGDDAHSTRVAVIGEAFARRQFADVDPVGRRIWIGGDAGRDSTWLTIVGVMPDLYAASATTANGNHFPAEVLTAFWQGSRSPTVTVALRDAQANGAAALRRTMSALDPDAPVYAVMSMETVLSQQLWAVRVFGTMFVIFGVVALVLAAIGLYAVMAFSVSRRVREMGIRVALGATSGDVIRLVCRQGAAQTLVGMTIGFLAGGAAVRVARAALFEVQPGDPTVFVLVAAVLGVAAFTACMVPAVRATRVDPVIALRAE